MAPSTVTKKDQSDDRRKRQAAFKGPDRRKTKWSGYGAAASPAEGHKEMKTAPLDEPVNPDAYLDDDLDKPDAGMNAPGTSISGSSVNPAARGTAEGPADEANMYGNDAVGPNLGLDLDDVGDDNLMALEDMDLDEEMTNPTLPPLEDEYDQRMFDTEDQDRRA